MKVAKSTIEKPKKTKKPLSKSKVVKEKQNKLKNKLKLVSLNNTLNTDKDNLDKPDSAEYNFETVIKNVCTKKMECQSKETSEHQFQEYKSVKKSKLDSYKSKLSSVDSAKVPVNKEIKIDVKKKLNKICNEVKDLFSTYTHHKHAGDDNNLHGIFHSIKGALLDSGKIEELKHSFNEENVDRNFSNKNGMEISEENSFSSVQKSNNSFKLYTADKTALLIMDESSTINFHGLMEVKVLFGAIEILGKYLDEGSPSTKVYSPRGSAFLSLKNRNISGDLNPEKLIQDIRNSGFNIDKANEISGFVTSTTGIILCKKIIDRSIEFITNNVSQVLFPYGNLSELQCEFWDYLDPERSVFSENEDWENIFKIINIKSKVFLSGGKNVGKSTLLRYLVNRLLNTFEEVLVIDLDPGQSEFTVPGCISAIKIRMPIIGPNYTHILKPDRCVFIPNYDVRSSHEMYLSCVKELLSLCEFKNIPTLINYIGFTKDLGAHLTASVICEVQPTTVVQIDSHLSGKNFDEDLTIKNIDKLKLLLSKTSKTPVFRLIKVNSMSQHNNWELEPRQNREMAILGYLGEILPEGCRFLTERGVKVYRCNISNIKLIYNGKPCDPRAVNGKLVALCTQKTNTNDASIYNCHGWGIVRGISTELDIIALLTPLTCDELDNIDHLIIGCVNLPPSIYLHNHKGIKGLVPYVYEGELTNYARNPKRNG